MEMSATWSNVKTTSYLKGVVCDWHFCVSLNFWNSPSYSCVSDGVGGCLCTVWDSLFVCACAHAHLSPSPPQQVPGRFSNPTLLCAEAKAQFPASKGPLFGLSFQISVSWAWTLLLLRTSMSWQQKALPAGLWSSQLSKTSMWGHVYS